MSPLHLKNLSDILPSCPDLHRRILIFIILAFLIFASGCVAFPGSPPPAENTIKETVDQDYMEIEASSESQENNISYEDMFEDPVPTKPAPTPIPTSSVVKVDTPYSDIPDRIPRQSVYFPGGIEPGRPLLHAVYTEQAIRLQNIPVGRMLDVINGPFDIHYTVHTNTNEPGLPWAVLTVRNPNGTVIAEDGYNRHYTSALSNSFRVYGNGTYHLTLDGEFVTLDLSLFTNDTVTGPVVTMAPYDEYYEDGEYIDDEESNRDWNLG